MTRDDIIRMARAADNDDLFDAMQVEFLERFATLAADAEAKRMHDEGMVTVGHMREQIAAAREAATEEANRRANASWTLMCEKMVQMERKACAMVVEHHGTWDYTKAIATAIRARGQEFAGFPVVIDESMPPDTFKVVGEK